MAPSRNWTVLLAALLSCTLAFGDAVIVPGATWVDTSGNVIQAHGAGIMKVCFNFHVFSCFLTGV